MGGSSSARTCAAVVAVAILLGLWWKGQSDRLVSTAWTSILSLQASLAAWKGGVPAGNVTVWWHAPFFSHGGYASEAAGLMLGLYRLQGQGNDLRISQHGDLFEASAWKESAHGSTTTGAMLQDMLEADKQDLKAMAAAAFQPLGNRTVVVCHSEPGAWALPEPLFQTSRCPPKGTHAFAVGRTMFECDRLPEEHVRRLNAMDEIWVPTEWQRQVFTLSGVSQSRMTVLPEAVDVGFFDPSKQLPRLPRGDLVFGGTAKHRATPPAFRFLSVFKWEQRKGWDVLLAAFLAEFRAEEDVELHLLTHPFHGDADFARQMQQWAASQGVEGDLPRVFVITRRVPQADLPGLYAAADAFVLPSRGEGWGRPHVEAMAMGLPVIATNWSGPTAFLDDSVGYPLAVEGLEGVTQAGAFQGCRWARPSGRHLRQLMRQVVSNRREAKVKGLLARQKMVELFSPGVVALQFRRRLSEIARLHLRA